MLQNVYIALPCIMASRTAGIDRNEEIASLSCCVLTPVIVCFDREPALAKHLRAMNVLTVGDLCSLTEQEVHHLPIAQPKVLNVRRTMNKFAARNQLNAGDVIDYQLVL